MGHGGGGPSEGSGRDVGEKVCRRGRDVGEEDRRRGRDGAWGRRSVGGVVTGCGGGGPSERSGRDVRGEVRLGVGSGRGGGGPSEGSGRDGTRGGGPSEDSGGVDHYGPRDTDGSPGPGPPPETVPVASQFPRPPRVTTRNLVAHVTAAEGRRGPDPGCRLCVPRGDGRPGGPGGEEPHSRDEGPPTPGPRQSPPPPPEERALRGTGEGKTSTPLGPLERWDRREKEKGRRSSRGTFRTPSYTVGGTDCQ